MRRQTTKKTRMTIDLLTVEHQRLKAIAALQGMSLQELVKECIFDKYTKVPTKATLKAMSEGENEKGLTSYKSVEEMFDSLGLS